MSYLDQLIQGAVQIGVAKAENPRAVQTVEQRQISTGQQTNAVVSNPGGSTPAGTVEGLLKDKRVFIGLGVVALGLTAYLALRS